MTGGDDVEIDSVSTFFRTIGGMARNSISVGEYILGRFDTNVELIIVAKGSS